MSPAAYTQECLDAARGKIPTLPDGTRAQSARVFRSSALELLGLAHPITPLLWWSPVVIYGAYTSVVHDCVAAAVGLVFVGLLAWTLLEYVLHRFVFQMPAHDEAGRFRRFRFHWYHNAFPNERVRLLSPQLMSWTPG